MTIENIFWCKKGDLSTMSGNFLNVCTTDSSLTVVKAYEFQKEIERLIKKYEGKVKKNV